MFLFQPAQIPTSLGVERIALLDALRVVAPPVRHADNLGGPEDQEDEQHVEVEARVEGRGEHEVVLGPHLVAVAVCPVHHHEPADEPREVPRRDVAVENGHPAKEDGRVPQPELGPSREHAVQSVDQRRHRCPHQECVRDHPPLFLLEELGRTL